MNSSAFSTTIQSVNEIVSTEKINSQLDNLKKNKFRRTQPKKVSLRELKPISKAEVIKTQISKLKLGLDKKPFSSRTSNKSSYPVISKKSVLFQPPKKPTLDSLKQELQRRKEDLRHSAYLGTEMSINYLKSRLDTNRDCQEGITARTIRSTLGNETNKMNEFLQDLNIKLKYKK